VMSIPDQAMPLFYKLILGWQPKQLETMNTGLADGSLHPNEIKMQLAREIVGIFHSPDSAQEAQKRWDEVFRSGNKDAVPADIPQETLTSDKKIVDILRDLKMVASGSEAKTLMGNDGIRKNGAVVKDIHAMVTMDELPVVLQVGKRKYVRLIQA
jgi:tyrosyl-tRNA synthetase